MEPKGKLFQLFILAYACLLPGLTETLLGTTLLDLQCTFHVGLDEVSSLFLSCGLAGGLGSLMSIIILKKCNVYFLMATMALLYSAGMAMVVATPYIEVAIIAIGCAGYSVGLLLIGVLFLCNQLFSEDAYAFHVLSSATSIGSLLSPVIAKTFLGTNLINETIFQQNIFLSKTSRHHGQWKQKISFPSNTSALMYNNKSETTCAYCENRSSAVNSLYILIGSLGLPLSIIFGLLFFWFNLETQNESYVHLDVKKSILELLYTVLLIISMSISFGLPYAYGSYIVVVGIQGPLHLDIQNMVILTSVFWLHSLLGRLISTAISLKVRQIVLIYICLIGDILAASLLIVAEGSEIFLWIGSLCLAIFSGPMFAAVLAWSREYITLTPCILALISLADNVGMALLPYVSGILISNFGEKSHTFYCLGLALLQIGILCGLHCIGSLKMFKV